SPAPSNPPGSRFGRLRPHLVGTVARTRPRRTGPAQLRGRCRTARLLCVVSGATPEGRWSVTAEQWQACREPGEMLMFLQGRATSRKLRLLASSGCRQFWGLLASNSRTAVGIAERYADGRAGKAELKEAFALAWQAVREAALRPGA